VLPIRPHQNALGARFDVTVILNALRALHG